MRSSLVTRVTLAYVALAAALVVFTCFATIVYALHLGVGRVNAALVNRRAEIRATAGALASGGRSFSEIARIIGMQEQRPGLAVQVLDPQGRVIAGPPAADRRSFNTVAGALFGAVPIEFPIDGGSVRMIPDPRRFGNELRSYVLFNIPIAIIAILLAWWAGRRISSRAVRPMTAVTGALNALADGDFSAKAIVGLDQTEVGVLIDAFNRATKSVARAMGERDRAQLDLRRFVADASHELRTPLTIVIGYIDALRHGVVTNPTGMTDIIEAVGEENQRMRRIVEDLITLARIDYPEARSREVVALRDVVSDVLAALPPQEKQRVRDAGGDAVIHVDAFAIHRAVRNIIDNSLRYTQKAVDVRVERDGAFALVTVEDQGPGMSEHEALLAFERFRRGRHEDGIEGTGLGLAIVKSAVEASGGTVTLRSSPERGTKVALRVPLAVLARLGAGAA